jgi:ribosomal protein L21
MYAVVSTGGKQYRVAPGDIIQIEKIPGENGDAIELSEVLLVAPDEGEPVVGRPKVEGAKVKGCIIGVAGQKDHRSENSTSQALSHRWATARHTGKCGSIRSKCPA